MEKYKEIIKGLHMISIGGLQKRNRFLFKFIDVIKDMYTEAGMKWERKKDTSALPIMMVLS